MAVAHEAWVGLGAAFNGAGFPAAGPVWHQIGGQHAEEFPAQGSTPSFGTGLEQSFPVAACGGQAAGKAHPLQGHLVASCRF